MKNHLLLGVIAIVLVTNASTANPMITKKSKKQVSLYWFIGGSTTYTGRQNTRAQEILISGCPDMGPLHCEDGYDDADLITSGAPYSGLKLGATINDYIARY